MRALVMGATGGLGRATCAALSAAGHEVVTVDSPRTQARANSPRSQARVDPPRSQGRADSARSQPQVDVVADLAEPGAARAAVTRAWESYGPLDALLHVAGLFPARRALETTEELFDTVMAVNTRSALMAATALADLCVRHRRPATVVLTSTGGALRPRPGTTVYAASKAALEAVTRGLALELGPLGVRVNAVAPGFVDVGSPLNPVPAAYVEAVRAASPAGRVATPADIVPSLLWLCSPDSAWVNGHVLAADGGAGLGSPGMPSWLGEHRTEAVPGQLDG
ncbi:SDR family NAD(P)-dependent oxidoreductase [Nonomuraea rubra]|uniref:3-oxoacyl-[acyl-carrier protein] reductase n=1 Tax=Nonomuraea rubra TaxID=46180 RepID=A0A7X0U541_9ACTN|nr:SDR family oxidoreductase [Nonomuraea rubra]MBB6555617.1 3-oxoacyl-[acyl-carrier protein] reductase [Nonomuraea rubra]